MTKLNQALGEALERSAPDAEAARALRAQWRRARQASPKAAPAIEALLAELAAARNWPAVLATLEIAAKARLKSWSEDAMDAVLIACRDGGASEEVMVRAEIFAAQIVQDLARLLHAGEALARLRPDLPDGTMQMVRALAGLSRYGEAEPHARRLTEQFWSEEASWIAAAELAESRGETAEALIRWEAVRAHFPHSRAGYLRPMALLSRARSFEAAGPLVDQALARFPDDTEVRVAAAQLCARGKKRDLASAQWQALSGMQPDNAHFALQEALALKGRAGGRRKRMPAVLEKLEEASRRFANDAPIAAALLSALRDLDRAEEAVTRGRDWCGAYGSDTDVELEIAGALGDLGRWAEARAVLEGALRAAPANRRVQAALALALAGSGDREGAERVARAALAEAPEDFTLLALHARLASRAGDLEEALRRWEHALRVRPDDSRISRQVDVLRTQMNIEAPAAARLSADDLFGNYLSLGATFAGCEFGVTQRHFGSADIGLMRWAKISLPKLREALEREFEGVGEEANTELIVRRGGIDDQEYISVDRCYGIQSHTLVRVGDIPADRMLQQTCRRLRFLRNKLLEDLRAGEKIFVFKIAERPDDDELRALFAAIRRYGEVNLLCAFTADEAHPARTVRVIERGLFAGYISFFMGNPNAGISNIDLQGWKSLALQTLALRDTAGFPRRLADAA